MTSADTETPQGVASLVSGILSDAQDLLKQQLTLFHQELQEDFLKARKAGTSLAAGMVTALVAGIIFSAALALLLNWAVPSLPSWAAFGIIGLVEGIVALTLVMAGKKKLDSFNPLPDQSVQAAKENVQWLMKK